MLERYIQALGIHDAGDEDPAATRERLKDAFPRGATRRMTQLGLLVGAAIESVGPREDDAVVYISAYAETRALEGYLDSFPTASPTLFQTSIHPSAVQQALIGRQRAVGEFIPLTGRAHLVFAGLQAALLSPAPRVVLCGGEERGTWLRERELASECSFGFALALTRDPAGALARVTLERDDAGAPAAPPLGLRAFVQSLAARRALSASVAPGFRLAVAWL